MKVFTIYILYNYYILYYYISNIYDLRDLFFHIFVICILQETRLRVYT